MAASALFLLLLQAAAATALRAQDGEQSGLLVQVHDLTGRLPAGTRLSVRGIDVPEARRAEIRQSGGLTFAHLAPGSYRIRVERTGAATQESDPFEVRLGAVTEIEVTLQGNVLTLAGRVSGQPGSEALPASQLPDQDSDGLLSLRGLASTQNLALLDGVEQTQTFTAATVGSGTSPAPDPDGDADSAELTTGPANGLSRGRRSGASSAFSQAAVRAFRVSSPGYSAQLGRAAGGVLRTASRSGGEGLHGSASFVLRSQALAASSPLALATTYAGGVAQTAVVKPHDLQERFGVSVGGPVPRAPVHYFYAFEQQRRGFPAVSSPADPAFYSLTNVQRALLANRGVSAARTDAALSYVASLTGPTSRRSDQTIHFIRVDGNRGGQGFGAEYNRVRWTAPAGLMDAPVVARARSSIGDANGSVDTVLGRVTSSLGARLLNQGRVSLMHDLQYEQPQAPLAQEPAIAPGGMAPEVNIGPNGLVLGTPASLSRRAYPDERRVQLADAASVTLGRHLVEFGGELSFTRDQVATLSNPAGTFRYDSGTTRGYAGGLVDFITDFTFNVNTNPNGGCPSIFAATHLFCFRSFSQSFGEDSVEFATRDWAVFAEDTWRPRPGLTVHLGVRYERTVLPLPATPNAALDAVFGASGATSVFPQDNNNVGPRASLAWEPLGAGKGTIRVGYGLFYGRVPGATIRSALSDTAQASATTRIRITPSASVACPQVQNQGFGYPCAFLARPTGVVAATTSAMVFDRRFRLPAVQQASLSLERSIFRESSVSATYIMNLDRQLPTSTDLNIAPSTRSAVFQLQGGTGAAGVLDGETFVVPLYTARISTAYGPVTDIVSNVNATYHGLALAAESRVGRSLVVRGSYTWSKALDTGQNQTATPRTDGQFDPFRNGYDKALSSWNYPWSMHAEAVWSPRISSAGEGVRRVVNGWRLEPVVVARAGRPYSLDISGGTSLAGGHQSINGSGGAQYLPTVGRNTLRLPATAKLDLRLQREFRAGSRANIQLQAEAFNLLNHRNISSVTQRAFLVGTAANSVTPLVFQDAAAIAAEGLNTQPFGTVTAAATGVARERQVQLSLRIGF